MKKITVLFLLVCSVMPVYSASVSIGSNQEYIVNGKPFFPLMGFAQPEKFIDSNKELGLNAIYATEGDPKIYLDILAKNGMFGSVMIGDLKEKDIKAIKDHPAFLWWGMADEVDLFSEKLNRAPILLPEEVIAKYKWIKSIDPSHPVDCGFGSGQVAGNPPIKPSMYPQFMPGMDTIGFDIYPCNRGEPDKLYYMNKGFKQLNKYDKGTKPHNVFMECNLFSKDAKARAPNPEELRAEVWMCVASGAKAIGYFTFSWAPSFTEFRVPENIKIEMKKINKQITDLTPVILSKSPKTEVTAANKGDSSTEVIILVKEAAGKLYLFTSNIKYKKGSVEFTVKGLSKGEITVFEENRKLTMNSGKFSDDFKEYEPHIYIIDKK